MSLQRRFLEDIATGIFSVVALTGDHYDVAGELIQRHGASLGLRTLDSLPLAVALGMHHAGAVENLVAADRVLCRVGIVEGMSVVDPESIS